ncbi:hypothetical protein GYH30_027343 [Glycine max]|nr:hypothetical protein GYH30_027343 [Glycine max]
MAVFSMSCRPWGTNEPCVTCSSKESYTKQSQMSYCQQPWSEQPST